MSRKFTDSEIRAYSKNRYEEKNLRRRLSRLKEDIGTFHDVSAKQKQHLVAESKEIRMTSGGSPVPPGFIFDSDFDISKRMNRPWAYSVMETTYNAAYRDAIIPLPKRSRPKSEVSRSLSMASSYLPSRSMSSKSRMSSLKSQSFVGSQPDTNHQLQELYGNGFQSFRRAHTDITVKIDRTHANDSICRDTDKIVQDAVIANGQHAHVNMNIDSRMESKDGTSDTKLDRGKQDIHQDLAKSEKGEACVVETVQILDDNNTSQDQANSFKPLKEYKASTKVITLPPMYKIDSKAYQEAERERHVSRSKSRVSFSGVSSGVSESHVERATRRSPPNAEPKHQTSDTGITDCDMSRSDNPETVENSNDNASLLQGREMQRSSTIFTLDPETMHDVRIRQIEEVMYKGQKLRNYIKPEDRYKLDPLVMKMRQNKMDKLAKESVSLLKRVNHENINVDIAFPRTERKRILTKLVQANNCPSRRRINNYTEPVIQKRVETFMDSISDYIKQQQLEREQFYA